MTGVAFQGVVVGPGALRLGDQTLPLRRAARGAAAEVTWHGVGYRVRAWTFGERRALLSAYVGGDGALDAAGLSDAALALLVRPMPEHPRDREVVALAALAWSATGGAAVAPPVPGVEPAAQAVRLAAATGWRPRDIDTAVAADVDRWFAALPGHEAASAPEQLPAPGRQDVPARLAAPDQAAAADQAVMSRAMGGQAIGDRAASGPDVPGQAAAPQAAPGETGDGFRIFRLED